MPLPIFLGIAAAIAAAGGVGSGVHGAVKMKGARDTAKAAGDRNNKNIARFEVCNSRTAKTMDVLGAQELDVLASFQLFSELFEKIQNKPKFREYTTQTVMLPCYDKEELKKVSVGASVLIGGISGATLGTAGGFAAAGATTAAVMALGTASTGTTIASLSGVAATNATLAALGGGALAAGGGGMALGTTILGVTSAGVGMLIGGVVFSVVGTTISHKADKAYEEMVEAEKKINKICTYLNELNLIASRYSKTLMSVNAVYRRHLNALDAIININQKNDWEEFTLQERLVTENTILLVQLLYKMCQVKLVLVAEEENGMNSVNRLAVEDHIQGACCFMEERKFDGWNLQTTEETVLNEEEHHYLAMVALLYYFARCDGFISLPENEIIDAAICPVVEEVSNPGRFLEEIEVIKAYPKFEFERLRIYLDRTTDSTIEEFEALVEQVIGASGGIKSSEKEAKKRLEEYIKFRKKKNRTAIKG